MFKFSFAHSIRAKGRLPGIVCAGLLVSGGLYAAYELGPRPYAKAQGPPAVELKEGLRGTDGNAASSNVPRESEFQCSSPVASSLLNLFGTSTSKVASGRASNEINKYIQTLERLYLQRGYIDASYKTPLKVKETSRRLTGAKKVIGLELRRQSSGRKDGVRLDVSTVKAFWRQERDGITILSAIGKDANPITDQADSHDYLYSTAAAAATDGSTNWITLRQEVPVQGVSGNNFSGGNADMPGDDPANVPRAPGTRRLMSIGSPDNPGETTVAFYSSNESVDSLKAWYMKEFMRGWQLSPLGTSEARQFGQGFYYFTKGDRYCLLWIESSADGNHSSVIVSAKN